MRDLQTEGQRGAGGLGESGSHRDNGPADLLAREETGTQVSCAAGVVAVPLQGPGCCRASGQWGPSGAEGPEGADVSLVDREAPKGKWGGCGHERRGGEPLEVSEETEQSGGLRRGPSMKGRASLPARR